MPAETENKLDYAVFLADLEAKKAVLERAIASIRAVMNGGALAVSVGDSMSMADGLSVSLMPAGEVPRGAFLSCYGATAKLRDGRLGAQRLGLGSGKRFAEHRGSDGCVGERINQDDATGGAITLVGIEEKRAVGDKFHAGDFVHLELIGWMLGEVIDVHAEADACRFGFEQAAGMLEQVLAIQLQGLGVKPDEHGREVSGDERWRVR